MTAMQRIPVALVTGFLGSGKTTLINAGLRAPELERTVVVVNEFGEVGLDHQLFAASSDAVVVLENGCLCCTVRGDLVTTLNDLYQRRQAGQIPDFDRVVIETSGLAEPGPVLQAFLSEPTLDGLFRVAQVLTLVDAVNFESTIAEHDEALRQIALADTILVSKLDLTTGDQAGAEARVKLALRRHNRAAEIACVDTTSAAVAARLTADGFDAANPKADPRRWLAAETHSHTHDHDHHDRDGRDHADLHFAAKGIESFVLARENPLSRAELQFLLDGIAQNLGPSLLRVKGLVNIIEEPGRPAVIQGAQHLLHTMTWLERWPDSDDRTRVVFITQGLVRKELEEMIAMLDRMSARTFAARERGRRAREEAERKDAS